MKDGKPCTCRWASALLGVLILVLVWLWTPTWTDWALTAIAVLIIASLFCKCHGDDCCKKEDKPTEEKSETPVEEKPAEKIEVEPKGDTPSGDGEKPEAEQGEVSSDDEEKTTPSVDNQL